MNARTPWILSAFYYLINESINERIDNNNALITLSSAASFSSASFSLASLVRDSDSSFNFCSCNGYISVYFYLPSHTHYRDELRKPRLILSFCSRQKTKGNLLYKKRFHTGTSLSNSNQTTASTHSILVYVCQKFKKC